MSDRRSLHCQFWQYLSTGTDRRHSLKKHIAEALEAAGHLSFIPPLERRGFLFVEGEENEGPLSFLEERFGSHVRHGTVIYPLGFGDWKDMLSAAHAYAEALRARGFTVETLEIPHSWNFFAYVLVLDEPSSEGTPATEVQETSVESSTDAATAALFL